MKSSDIRMACRDTGSVRPFLKRLGRWLPLVLCGALSLVLSDCGNHNTAISDEDPAVGSTDYTTEDFTSVAKFDSHIHLNTEDTTFINQAARDNLRFLVIVDDRPFGITMEDQEKIVRRQVKAFPERIAYATTFSTATFGEDYWLEDTQAYLDNSFREGAIAVKVWKNIGMDLRDRNGKFVMIDNPAFDPLLDYLEEKGIPLIGHLGEPRDCWLPLEKMTFHQGYYKEHPEYHMYLHPEYPTYEDQIDARDHMLEKHPGLKFIGAHLGSMEWSLEVLAAHLDKYPNMAVDLSRMTELKYHAMREWQKTRDFFVKYQDRLLYATDIQVKTPDDAAKMNQNTHDNRMQYWNFFATNGRFIVPGKEGEGKGLQLPREVIDKIYFKNAQTWLFGNAGKPVSKK